MMSTKTIITSTNLQNILWCEIKHSAVKTTNKRRHRTHFRWHTQFTRSLQKTGRWSRVQRPTRHII